MTVFYPALDEELLANLINPTPEVTNHSTAGSIEANASEGLTPTGVDSIDTPPIMSPSVPVLGLLTTPELPLVNAITSSSSLRYFPSVINNHYYSFSTNPRLGINILGIIHLSILTSICFQWEASRKYILEPDQQCLGT